MNKILAITACAALAAAVPAAAQSEKAPVVQIALLLDTSGSMDGLLEQAKTRLWRIVTELATAKRRGKTPRLELALYEYGKSSLPASDGYIRQVLPLSTNLDKVSEELFALRTNGGDEFAGQAISRAAGELAWSPEADALKLVFVAGNESYAQGPVDFKDAAKAALAKGITVNTIYCGSEAQGIADKWQEGAKVGDGRFLHIDQSRTLAQVAAPQDAELARLSGAMNKTYVAYGARGAEGKRRQEAQDAAAGAAAPAAVAMRASAKASALYDSASWDLVEASAKGQVALESVREEDLAPELRRLAPAARKEYLGARLKERQELQKKVQKLSAERERFLAESRKTSAGEGSLDEAVLGALREQAQRKGYRF